MEDEIEVTCYKSVSLCLNAWSIIENKVENKEQQTKTSIHYKSVVIHVFSLYLTPPEGVVVIN